jgi:sulfite reductase (ferredoxin)
MSAASTWKDKLAGEMPEGLAREIDIFETQIELRRQDKIEERLFAETRLRRGVYGQRYDNGHRHDGVEARVLPFPSGDLTKGPSTMWDAPGMQRIKIPFGKVSAEQLEVLAECAEEYSDSILHVTTRQDIQLHFVHIEDTPDMMRRLAAVGITSREACGNSVRNVTACQYAGVCNDESFDVQPYAHAITYFLLGHDDTQDFGRKFKIAFSGCKDHPCGLVSFHDLGVIAVTREENGTKRRGFEFYVGGGLGSVPQAAKLLDEFLPEEELLPMSQAVCRVFGRLGEKENRARARLKFLIKKIGMEEFVRLVREERGRLRDDPRWTAFLSDLNVTRDQPVKPGAPLGDAPQTAAFDAWRKTNARPQSQPGYVVATVSCPLGDITSDQARQLADLARRFAHDGLRTTVEQNFVFRWVPEADLPELYEALEAIGLGEPGACTVTDITSCPGTDTCKLGISSSRGLSGELRRHLRVVAPQMDPAAQSLHIKASGCFNACGQHHVADLGFLGVSRTIGNRRVPHFQVVVGGEWTHNARSFGLALGAVPSKNVPRVVDAITRRFVADRRDGENMSAWVGRVGKKEVRAIIEPLCAVPTYEEDPSYYSDWGDPREYSIGDMGVGECAGEVIPFAQMALAAAEREVFEAQLMLDQGQNGEAERRAFQAMLSAGRALTRERDPNVGDEPDEIVAKFRVHLFDTKLFFDPYAGGKFAQFLFRAHRDHGGGAAATTDAPQADHAGSAEAAHQRIEEAQLFVEASYQCYERMMQAATAAE